MDTSHKITVALFRILESRGTNCRDYTYSNAIFSVEIPEAGHVAFSKTLAEWLLLPTMTTCRALINQDVHDLAKWSLTNCQAWPKES